MLRGSNVLGDLLCVFNETFARFAMVNASIFRNFCKQWTQAQFKDRTRDAVIAYQAQDAVARIFANLAQVKRTECAPTSNSVTL